MDNEGQSFTPKFLLDLNQRIVREQGMCGELSPDGSRICILAPDHDESHPWDTSELNIHIDKLVNAVKEAIPSVNHGPMCNCNICSGFKALAELGELAHGSKIHIIQ
jgi:hypothetical protein